jgi:DNA-binding transcriptional LysR family regulator
MTLTQLKYAITVSDEKSMNAAAKKLFISQPSLSASIKELEEEIDVELFYGPIVEFRLHHRELNL